MPSTPTGPVLVTGGFGLVGTATVTCLRRAGHSVVVADLDTPGNRAAAARGGIEVVWTDLTDETAVAALMQQTQPAAVVHLAALIPPLCYARPVLARKVNVAATGLLLAACEQLPTRPRFVHASSIAVNGSRNPYSVRGPLTAETPMAPSDLYGSLKAEAETLVRASSLDWVALRLGGVMTAASDMAIDRAAVYLGSCLPGDGRIQSVDVRDVARAFTAAVTAPVVAEVLMIGGDDSHRLHQRELVLGIAGARGAARALPRGRDGDPADDAAWFATDWMDSGRAQAALDFQRVTWPALLAEVRAGAGPMRQVMRVLSPALRPLLGRDDCRRLVPGHYVDPWAAVRARWGEIAAPVTG